MAKTKSDLCYKNFNFSFLNTLILFLSIYSLYDPAPPMGERFPFKFGKWEMLGSILGRACRPSRTKFSVIFSETRLNTG